MLQKRGSHAWESAADANHAETYPRFKKGVLNNKAFFADDGITAGLPANVYDGTDKFDPLRHGRHLPMGEYFKAAELRDLPARLEYGFHFVQVRMNAGKRESFGTPSTIISRNQEPWKPSNKIIFPKST